MESGNEVIIVEEKVTNGINGNYEEVSAATEMKTRSKAQDGGVTATDDGSAAKPKPRTRNAAVAQTSQKSDEKAGSDSEKKDKKRAGGVETDAKNATAITKKAPVALNVEGTPSKKKSGSEREDDSGINSRSSSVSNEETYSSRRRTRSQTAEALSSSTPASKKGAPRMAYDFEDISFDEEPSTSLKRKAMYVEEMEEPEEQEPPAKRTSYGFVSVLLNPLRAIRGRISIASQTDKVEVTKDDVASQTHLTKVSDDDPEKENVASQTEHAIENQKPTGSCVVM